MKTKTAFEKMILPIPPLHEVQVGEWKLLKNKLPRIPLAGYYSRPMFRSPENWALVQGEKIWMSTTPMERESQMLHVQAAHGSVIVGGLGLGVLLWALLNKPTVEHIVVVEKNESVLAIFSQVVKHVPQWQAHLHFDGASIATLHGPRVEIVHGDIFSFRPGRSIAFDFGLVDVWPAVGDLNLRPDLQRLRKFYPLVNEWAAWGMEMDFVSWLIENSVPSYEHRPRHWSAYSDSIGVPLILRDWPGMAEVSFEAAKIQALTSIGAIV